MLSSILRPKKGRAGRERSPFSSPYAGLQSSPIAARRSGADERRRAAAELNDDEASGERQGVGDEEEDDDDDDLTPDYGADEDGHDEATPLLPIFSAAHLGIPLHVYA